MLKSLLVFLLLFGQYGIPSHTGATASVAVAVACNAPTMTNRWSVYASSGTNGSGLATLVDAVAGNNAVQATGGSQPIYATGAVNGLPALTYNSSSQMQLTTGLAGTTGAFTATFYAVVKPSNTTGTFPIMGNSGNSVALEWRIAAGHQELLTSSVRSLGVGTAVISSTSYSTLIAQYNNNFAGGGWAFYLCSAGTCTSDGSGSNGNYTFDQVVNSIGQASPDGSFVGSIAEFGYFNGTTTAGIAAWSACQYGI